MDFFKKKKLEKFTVRKLYNKQRKPIKAMKVNKKSKLIQQKTTKKAILLRTQQAPTYFNSQNKAINRKSRQFGISTLNLTLMKLIRLQKRKNAVKLSNPFQKCKFLSQRERSGQSKRIKLKLLHLNSMEKLQQRHLILQVERGNRL